MHTRRTRRRARWVHVAVAISAALYENGVLVRPLAYWRTVGEPKTGRRLTYTVVR